MRRILAILCAATLFPSAVALGAVRKNHRVRQYRRAMISKSSAVGSVAGAVVGQVRNSPHEWGRGIGGFTKRVGSNLGQHAIKGAVELGVSTWHHENLSFQPSNLQGTWPRMKYAARSTFIVPRTDRPGKTVALGRISGNMSAGLISRAWQPASTAGLGAGIASGGVGLGADVGVHMVREFLPRKHRVQRARRR